MTLTLKLEERSGLPDALRVLLEQFPREGWEAHPNFSEMTRFWLSRHLMFRDLVARLETGAAARLDNDIDPKRHAREVSHYGGFLLNELHMHHHMEDHHYFPQLKGLDARVEAGFDILDADHHALDAHIAHVAEAANTYLQRWEDTTAHTQAGAVHKAVRTLGRFLDRHLTDEEELIVPVILQHAPDLH